MQEQKEAQKPKPFEEVLDWLISVSLSLPWLEIVAELWKVIRTLSRGLANEGMYEVLAYESVLELMDKSGRTAQFRKRERVKYLQDNIIAYQDQAWGDGKILLNYRCTPGHVVDRYRPGQKSFMLISLRENKSRGDIDEFHIEWQLRDGFRRRVEQWETEVSHKTQSLELQLVFPPSRPPIRLWLIEFLRRRTKKLDQGAMKRLPDGRWLVTWETSSPRLHERYILKWEW